MSLPIDQGSWVVDPTHSSIAFIVKHLGFTKVRGTFSEFSSTVKVGDSLESSSVNAQVNLLSVSSGSADRDEHLKGADIFGGSDNPTMTFVSTAISGSEKKFTLTGDLTINGKTMPVNFEAQFEGTVSDPFGNTKAGFEAKAEINRTDFGIEWNVPVGSGLLVSEKVKVELDIQLQPAG